jgi:nucleoside-diphosphate-sugar epimerase
MSFGVYSMALHSTQAHYKGNNAIVLGASGFIGRWVARALSECGANVFLVVRDDLTAGKIFSSYGIDGEVCKLDLRDGQAVRKLFARVRPAITFNLAGYGVDPLERDEETAYNINTQLVQTVSEVLPASQEAQWTGQQVIHIGSALEYGEIDGDLDEDSAPNPTTLYGKSKLAGTNLLTRCCRERGIKGLTARLFTVYGPGEHDGRLLPSLLEAAETGQPVLLTAGVQKRDFTYVGDVANGLLRLGLTATTKPGEVVNLATGQLTSVRRFVEAAASILRIPSDKLRFDSRPTRVEEMQHSAVTIERLRQLTGWRPPTSVAEGICKTQCFRPLREPVEVRQVK